MPAAIEYNVLTPVHLMLYASDFKTEQCAMTGSQKSANLVRSGLCYTHPVLKMGTIFGAVVDVEHWPPSLGAHLSEQIRAFSSDISSPWTGTADVRA